MTRYALVSLHGSSVEQIERYLPGNYAIIRLAPHDSNAPGTDPTHFASCAVIAGEDNCGWTLDGYVIPRLQSGLIGAKEIDLNHPVMKAEMDLQGSWR